MVLFKLIWHKFLGGKSVPWADIQYEAGKVRVRAYNKAFVNNLRSKFNNLTDGKNDAEVVQLFSARESLEIEEPKLDVVHSGITDDGRIKMQLDWNQAFIRHLADNGITAETEEEAVQTYLSLLTNKFAGDVLSDRMSSEEVLGEAFQDLDLETQAELEEAARQVEAQAAGIREMKKPRRRRKLSSPQVNAATNEAGF